MVKRRRYSRTKLHSISRHVLREARKVDPGDEEESEWLDGAEFAVNLFLSLIDDEEEKEEIDDRRRGLEAQ